MQISNALGTWTTTHPVAHPETLVDGTVVDGKFRRTTVDGRVVFETDSAGVEELTARATTMLEDKATVLEQCTDEDLVAKLHPDNPDWDGLCTSADLLASTDGVWEKTRTGVGEEVDTGALRGIFGTMKSVAKLLRKPSKQVGIALGVAAALTIGGLGAGTAVGAWGADSVVSAPVSRAACQVAAPQTPAQFTAMVGNTPSSVHTGSDGWITLALPDGSTYVFVADNWADGRMMTHNGALRIEKGCVERVQTVHFGNELFASHTNTAGVPEYRWPNGAVVNTDGTVTVFASIMTFDTNGANNNMAFRQVGNGSHTGKFSINEHGQTVWTKVSDNEFAKDRQGITWGSGAGSTEQGEHIIYGTRNVEGKWDKEVYVAKTNDATTDPETWQKHTAAGWVAGGVAEPINLNGGTVVSPWPGNPGTYITAPADMLGDNVTINTIDLATGAATGTRVLTTRPTHNDGRVSYGAQVIPLADVGGGTPGVAVTVMQNRLDNAPQEQHRADYNLRTLMLTKAAPNSAEASVWEH